MAFTAPNLLTFFRIAVTPVLVWLLLYPEPLPSALAAALFLAATLSDLFDGYLARSYNWGSTLGKFLDPLADKLIVSAVLIMLAGMPRMPRVPAWMVVVVVVRELLVTALRTVAAAEGRVLAAEELGKYKMVLQSMAVQALLIHYTYFHINFHAAGIFLLWIALVLSVWSGLDYYLRAVERFGWGQRRTVGQKRAAI